MKKSYILIILGITYVVGILFFIAVGILLNAYGYLEFRNICYGITTAWLIVFPVIVAIMVFDKQHNLLPIETQSAEIISKGWLDYTEAVGEDVYIKKSPALTFKLSSGQLLTFPVPWELYNAVLVNDRGILAFKRKNNALFYFVSFQRQQ